MSAALAIARDELRLLARNRVAVLAVAMLMLLTGVAAITSFAHRDHVDGLRARLQVQANREFDAQPDRHPHRVVHYGHFVFRPLGPLAAFDPGVDPFTGNLMFLEGHRQNSANFSDVRQSSLLIRFGQLTPAFVLQVLAPLLLIFLGYGAIARERERGTLRQLLVQGVRGGQLGLGKLTALLATAALVAAPALVALAIAGSAPGAGLPALVVAGGYLAYLATWALIVALASLIARRARDALLALLALWSVTTVLVPRIAPDIALAAVPLATRLENDVSIQRDLRRLGDSHNPDDPYFAAFKQRTLARYGVTRVEDLPVNYRGLLAVEGEKLSSELFGRYARADFERQFAQTRIVDGLAALSPGIALRRLSMAAAGTDLDAHRRFVDQAEAYRFDIVQRLNRLQAEAVSAADDAAKSDDADAEKRSRIAASHWQDIPDFAFRPAPPDAMARTALPALGILLAWVAVLAALLAFVSVRLRETRA